ncbi:hypothetical protein DVH24_001987 [Malus domestica]|uniref:Uncharacterized protein n=1 Tax=Malus domestica TaxID=3750 RepID=A0A498I6F0_MALDO|nr:hypothetical protein DVH24_001987 [Malus domestica]
MLLHEAFWELTGFGFRRNSKVKRVRERAFPIVVTHWEILVTRSFGSSLVLGSVGTPNLSEFE